MAKGEPFHLHDKGAISSLHPRRGRSSISRFDSEPRFVTNRSKPLCTSRTVWKEWQWIPWIVPGLDHKRCCNAFWTGYGLFTLCRRPNRPLGRRRDKVLVALNALAHRRYNASHSHSHSLVHALGFHWLQIARSSRTMLYLSDVLNRKAWP